MVETNIDELLQIIGGQAVNLAKFSKALAAAQQEIADLQTKLAEVERRDA